MWRPWSKVAKKYGLPFCNCNCKRSCVSISDHCDHFGRSQCGVFSGSGSKAQPNQQLVAMNYHESSRIRPAFLFLRSKGCSTLKVATNTNSNEISACPLSFASCHDLETRCLGGFHRSATCARNLHAC